MRRRIKAVGDRDRSFLPLWMRSIQDREFVETGYLAAVVLCYAKPGTSEKIISRIRSRTTFASRGAWDPLAVYRLGDSVSFAGETWTSITTLNQNQNPQKSTNSWLKNFNFKSIDFTADRYLIDILDRQLEARYLAFPQQDILNKVSNSGMRDVRPTVIPVVVQSFNNNDITFTSLDLTFDQG